MGDTGEGSITLTRAGQGGKHLYSAESESAALMLQGWRKHCLMTSQRGSSQTEKYIVKEIRAHSQKQP